MDIHNLSQGDTKTGIHARAPNDMRRILRRFPFARKVAELVRIRARGPKIRLLEIFSKGRIGAEIGVHLGDFSESILDTARPEKLLLIDPWKYEGRADYKSGWYGGTPDKAEELERRYKSVQARFAREIRSGQVTILRQTSEVALAQLSDQSLDYIYIDGNHLYEYVKTDLELSFRKVNPGGFIAGDDYTPGGWWKGGVKKAVDEFGWKDGVTLLWIEGGQFVFRKR